MTNPDRDEERVGGMMMERVRDPKPLGRKAYGSIPHLPSSRIGPGDHYCHPGQEVILTAKARDKHDRIVVTEKLDGACVAIAKIDGQPVALIRAGYPAALGKYEHLRLFDTWVKQNAPRFDPIPEGTRLCGEWLAMAHGTQYVLDGDPFVPFDLMSLEKRHPIDEMAMVAALCGLRPAKVLHDGGPVSIGAALEALGPLGHHGATETPEGAVWRCERRGEFDFIAKFVRHEKRDGAYLPEISGVPPIWHWLPN
jgi:hypothetical protein